MILFSIYKSISPIIEINGYGKQNRMNIAICYNRIVNSLVIKRSNYY